jgi:hypothetical protein
MPAIEGIWQGGSISRRFVSFMAPIVKSMIRMAFDQKPPI